MRRCEVHVDAPQALIGQNSDAPRATSCKKRWRLSHQTAHPVEGKWEHWVLNSPPDGGEIGTMGVLAPLQDQTVYAPPAGGSRPVSWTRTYHGGSQADTVSPHIAPTAVPCPPAARPARTAGPTFPVSDGSDLLGLRDTPQGCM